MKKLLVIIAILSCPFSLFAQDGNRVKISATEYYSFGNNKINEEVSVGYVFNSFALNLNVDWYNLPGSDILGESISFSVPSKQANSFSIIPEIGIGIAHGEFDNNDSSVKIQSYIGSSLNFRILTNLSSGLVMRFVAIGDYTKMFMLGSRLVVDF